MADRLSESDNVADQPGKGDSEDSFFLPDGPDALPGNGRLAQSFVAYMERKLLTPSTPTERKDIPAFMMWKHCEYARCRKIISSCGVIDDILSEQRKLPIWKERPEPEPFAAIEASLQRAKEHIGALYDGNPLYPRCDCPIFKQLLYPWPEQYIVGLPVIRALDHQL